MIVEKRLCPRCGHLAMIEVEGKRQIQDGKLTAEWFCENCCHSETEVTMEDAYIECPMCNTRMREVLGDKTVIGGMIEREWQCPECLHTEKTKERISQTTK